MGTVRVALAERSYDVVIEPGLLGRAGAQLGPPARHGRRIVVSDETVWEKQGARLCAGLSAGDGTESVEPILLPPGEESKSWPVLTGLVDRLLALGLERGEPILAFGGGVIGDLAGFAAAIVKRGCPFVQIPTTLLAQVDSSVGGKTGINTAAGKNLVGAFHQPSMVLIDPDCLDTLPLRELHAGYAEVAKCGLIGDADFFAWCEANARALFAGDPEARSYAIEKSVAFKAAIVAEDERETTGRRALLNLGHTFGHALEAETGFSERLLHGEAVALGMVLAFRFSAERGLCPAEDAARIEGLFDVIPMPVHLTDLEMDATGATLAAHMAHDKKASGGHVPFVLARGIGRAFIDTDVDLAEIADFLDRQRLTFPAVTA